MEMEWMEADGGIENKRSGLGNCGKTAPKPQTPNRGKPRPNRGKPRLNRAKPRLNHSKTAGITVGNLTKTADISPRTAGKLRAVRHYVRT